MGKQDDQDRYKAIGKRIKELRLKAGYSSLETFANEHDLSRRNYWRLESGGNFKMSTLFRILKIHKIPLEAFFKGLM